MNNNFNKTNFNQPLPEDKDNNRVINNKSTLKSRNNRIVYDLRHKTQLIDTFFLSSYNLLFLFYDNYKFLKFVKN